MKERIVGAIVLVAVVVLVVPVFLDGPPGSGETVSERVPLPGQTDQRTQTVVLDRDREEPVPAPLPERAAETEDAADDSESTSPPEAESEAPVVVATAAEPTADEPESPAVIEAVEEAVSEDVSAASTTGMFAVQLGSFLNQANAESLAADLRRQGFAAFLSQHSGPSGPLHRVRIGPQKDREAAEAMASRLEAAGHEGQVVPHP